MNDRECTSACTIPISFFPNVYCNAPECKENLTWEEFQELLRHYADIEYGAKQDAPLLSPTVFNGTRSKANATDAGAVVIDADDGLWFEDALNALRARGLAAILYTTASNRVGDRFRIVIPLAGRVDPETYKRVLIAICRTISGRDWRGDIGKVGPYNLFYLPGRYKGADNRFQVLLGIILSPNQWLELCAVDEPSAEPLHDARKTKSIDTTWTALTDCPFVRGDWVNEYLNLSSGWYAGLYKFMVRVAMSARAQGWALTAMELADLARELDDLDGAWYPDRELEREAENALAWAAGCAAAFAAKPVEFTPIWEDEDERANEVDPSEWQDPPELINNDDKGPAEYPSDLGTSRREGLPPVATISGVTPYAFEDLLFTGRGGAEPRPAFEFLALRCAGRQLLGANW